jgi:hypothetical protein
MLPTITPQGLCPTCRFVRLVHGRRGQTYLLCQNDRIEAKYPQQPVVACPGYEPEPDVDAATARVPTG